MKHGVPGNSTVDYSFHMDLFRIANDTGRASTLHTRACTQVCRTERSGAHTSGRSLVTRFVYVVSLILPVDRLIFSVDSLQFIDAPSATAGLTPPPSHRLLPHLERNWCTSTAGRGNPSPVSPSTLPLVPRAPSLSSPPQFVMLPFLSRSLPACRSSRVIALLHAVQGEQGIFFLAVSHPLSH